MQWRRKDVTPHTTRTEGLFLILGKAEMASGKNFIATSDERRNKLQSPLKGYDPAKGLLMRFRVEGAGSSLSLAGSEKEQRPLSRNIF